MIWYGTLCSSNDSSPNKMNEFFKCCLISDIFRAWTLNSHIYWNWKARNKIVIIFISFCINIYILYTPVTIIFINLLRNPQYFINYNKLKKKNLKDFNNLLVWFFHFFKWIESLKVFISYKLLHSTLFFMNFEWR